MTLRSWVTGEAYAGGSGAPTCADVRQHPEDHGRKGNPERDPEYVHSQRLAVRRLARNTSGVAGGISVRDRSQPPNYPRAPAARPGRGRARDAHSCQVSGGAGGRALRRAPRHGLCEGILTNVRGLPRARRPIALIARGPCWLSVRAGSESGRVLYERMLQPGQRAGFAGARLWIRIGAPWNVDAFLDGKRVALPNTVGNVIVTRRGVRPL